MHYQELKVAKNQMQQQISSVLQSNDPKKNIKACIGIRILGKLKPYHSDDYLNSLAELLPCEDPVASEFITYMEAKFCRKNYLKDPNFIIKELNRCKEWLSGVWCEYKVNTALNLLRWFSRFASSTLLISSQHFLDSLEVGIMHKSYDVRVRSENIFSDFLGRSKKGPKILTLIQTAKKLLSSDLIEEQHGALIVMSGYAQNDPELFTSSAGSYMKICRDLMKSESKFLSIAALRLLIILAPLDPIVFRNEHSEFIKQYIWHDTRPTPELVQCNIMLLKHLPEIFEQHDHKLMSIMRGLFSQHNEESTRAGLQLLSAFSADLPSIFKTRLVEVAGIIAIAGLSEDFLEMVPPILHDTPALWNLTEKNIAKIIINEITQGNCIIPLRIIAKCPIFTKNSSEQILPLVKPLLNSKDSTIRKYTPAALLALSSDIFDESYGALINDILSIAISEMETENRLAIIESFTPPYSPFLSFPSSLEFFSVLVNDDSFRVRSKTLSILGQLAEQNPSMILPIFRKVMLDALFICESSPLLKLQAQTTRCFTIIIKACGPILPIYVHAFIPIATSYLRSHCCHASAQDSKQYASQLTFFEQEYSVHIAINFIDSIALVCQMQTSLLAPQFKVLASLFIDILEQTTQKRIAISALTALCYIIDYIGANALQEFPQLLHVLFTIGSKFSSWRVHTAIFKLYGRFGAATPEKEQISQLNIKEEKNNYEMAYISGVITLTDWITTVVADAILCILADEQQYPLHFQSLQILTALFTDISLTTKPFFNQFITILFHQIRAAALDEKEPYLNLLRENLVAHPGPMKVFAGQFAALINEFRESSFLVQVLSLLPEITLKLEEAFSPLLPQIVTSLLDKLFDCEEQQPNIAQAIIVSLTKLSAFGQDFVFIILRQIFEVINNPTSIDVLVLTALDSLLTLVRKYDCSSYSSLIVRACFLSFHHTNTEIKEKAIKLLITAAQTLGPAFMCYKKSAILQLQESNLMTKEIEDQLNGNIVHEEFSDEESLSDEESSSESTKSAQLSIDNSSIILVFQCEQTFTAVQWKDWLRGIMLTLISQAPSLIVKRCYSLAQSCTTFAQRLLHAAFLMCWDQISPSTRLVICKSINSALISEETPMQILTQIVSLAEFMEKTEKHLNISYDELAKAALRVEKLPFALFCAQKTLDSSELSIAAVEMILQIYSQLALEDDVHGLIHTLRESKKLNMTPKFAEQLGDWQTVISLYKNDVENNDSFVGLIRSYSMICDYKSIAELFTRFDDLPATCKSQTSQIFAHAFYHINDWPHFNVAIKHCPLDSIPAIITHCLAKKKLGLPYNDLIEEGFRILGLRAGSLFPHGFSSFATFLIQAEMLVELGEENPSFDVWASRIKAPHLTFQQLQPLILMRIELLGALNAQTEILTLLKLSRNANEWSLHDTFFQIFYPDFNVSTSSPAVVFERALDLWKRQNKVEALEMIDKLIDRLETCETDEEISLKERVLLVKAKWIIRFESHENDAATLTKAAELTKESGNSHKAMILWAWTQLRLYNMKGGDRESFAINAINAFIKNSEGLAEMMQLCSTIFRAGKYHNVFNTVKESLEGIKSDLWLPMLPQLFAQFTNPIPYLAEFAMQTVWKCLLDHHHAVIFSLILCIHISEASQAKGRELFQAFSKMRPDVTESASIIYCGLLNACTTKAEMWHENLSIAIELFKREKIQEMKVALDKIFSTIKVVSTDADLYFTRTFGDRLNKIQAAIKRFFMTKKRKDIDPALHECRDIIRDLKREIEYMTSVPLRFLAPKLSELRDIPIAVPGTYWPGKPLITMSKFASSLEVFPSKQRPKRIAIIGSDGNEFWYLLKGHEDLRLDQRVVQVFHLINSFIPQTMPRIVTNFIMPLSPSAGLIQWILGSDTVSKLIREYRTARNIPLDLESKAIAQLTIAKLDDLRPIQRMEALETVAQQTSDSVLSDILWLKAPDAESWVKRVTTFSRTSALMSVVGYILGLGDRHLSNLMIHNYSGSVIHIDFENCFEVAKERVLFPELIPFRLTRFMIRAFGPAGIDGSFRKTCLDIVRIIRRKREDVLSVLEIFAHAPLVRNGIEQIKASKNTQHGPSSSLSLINVESEVDISKHINRISEKINGKDFDSNHRLTQQEQVEELIKAATDMYNLAHLYHGWNPLW